MFRRDCSALVLAGPEDLTLRLGDGRHLQFALSETGGHIIGNILFKTPK